MKTSKITVTGAPEYLKKLLVLLQVYDAPDNNIDDGLIVVRIRHARQEWVAHIVAAKYAGIDVEPLLNEMAQAVANFRPTNKEQDET